MVAWGECVVEGSAETWRVVVDGKGEFRMDHDLQNTCKNALKGNGQRIMTSWEDCRIEVLSLNETTSFRPPPPPPIR